LTKNGRYNLFTSSSRSGTVARRGEEADVISIKPQQALRLLHGADGPEPFAVAVQRRDDLAIVRPSGELDVATVETLRAALDSVRSAGRLLLDLRGLSFIDSAGLHLLVVLAERAQGDRSRLTLVAPPAPVDRTIRLCGLDEALPFAAAVEVVGAEPRESLLADRGSGR
jgi:anti-anti-sigma factor